MKHDIIEAIRTINEKYKTECLYFPDDDIYSIRFRGRAVQNFTSKQFYMIPKRFRFNQIGQIIHLGLNHNVGERSLQNQLYLNRAQGKKL